MKRHLLTFFLALLVSGGAFAYYNNSTFIGAEKIITETTYVVIVETKDLGDSKEYFLDKTAKLLQDLYGLSVLSSKAEDGQAIFEILGEDNAQTKEEIMLFFNKNGYPIQSITTK